MSVDCSGGPILHSHAGRECSYGAAVCFVYFVVLVRVGGKGVLN